MDLSLQCQALEQAWSIIVAGESGAGGVGTAPALMDEDMKRLRKMMHILGVLKKKHASSSQVCIYLSIYLYIYLSVYGSIYLSIYLSVH